MNSRFKATERTTNACRKGRNAGFSLMGLVRTAICTTFLKRKRHFREYSLQTSSIHCSVFGDVLIHDTSSASEGAQALDIYVNRDEKNLIYNWHIGDDKILSSDKCCHLGI
jgi:hypothetical protein